MCNFGFNGDIRWLCDTDGANCLICEHTVDNHFITDCPKFRDNFALLRRKLKLKVCSSDPTDRDLMANFLNNLDQHSKMLLILGSLLLPFDDMAVHSERRFITLAVGKS